MSGAAPGCGRVSRVITRMRRNPRYKERQSRLASYHLVLGRLANINSHLVGGHSTHKVTREERKATSCIWGRLSVWTGPSTWDGGLPRNAQGKPQAFRAVDMWFLKGTPNP